MEEASYNANYYSEYSTQIADLEERYRVVKDRVLLIGKNLIGFRDKTEKDITELKIKTEELSEEVKRIKNTLLRLSEEMEKFVRRNDFEILAKQMKMFLQSQN